MSDAPDSLALAWLRERQVPHRVHVHAPIGGYESAKALLPFDPAAMVKGLAFRLTEGACAIVALRAADRADYRKIADALGVRRADLQLATPEDIAAQLGMVPGGVAPVPVGGARLLVDASVAGLGAIFCGSGRNDATLEIRADELLRATQAPLSDLVKR